MSVWKVYNPYLVDRIVNLWDFSFLEVWNKILEKMNENKVGRPYKFPTPFILWLAILKVTYRMPYRDLEAMIIGLRKLSDRLIPPNYTTIFRRVDKLSLDLRESIPKNILHALREGKGEIAVDSSGLSITVRGEWLRHKHKTGRPIHGFIKLHVAVDIRKGTILGVEVTHELVHDNRALPSLVYQAKNKSKVKTLYADTAYDSHENFLELEKRKIKPVIKPRIYGKVIRTSKGYIAGTRSNYLHEIREYGYDYWRKKHNYGERWLSECVFSSFKRRFGENLVSKKIKHMEKEVALKVVAYNKITDWPRGW